MTQIVIDTNTYSFLCHGQKDVAELLASYDAVIIPSIVLGELEAGFRKGNRYQFNKSQLERFLLVDRVRVANVDPRIAEAYGLVYQQLKKCGVMIPLNDVWIGATAVALNAPLLTYDKHFSKIEGLNLILKEVAK